MNPGDLCHLLPKMSSEKEIAGTPVQVGASSRGGVSETKLFPYMRVKVAASPLVGERREESQEPPPSTLKFTRKKAKTT